MILGKRLWVIPGGFIPFASKGKTPSFISHDRLAMLNAGDEDTEALITIYYEDRDPAGPHRIAVRARRVRVIRFNDLIDPLPVPLETPYAAVIESGRPLVVQFTRMDTGAAARALMGTIAYGQ